MPGNILTKQGRSSAPGLNKTMPMLLIGLMTAILIFFPSAYSAAGELILDNAVVEENLPAGTAVGQFLIAGQSGDTPVCTLLPGEEDNDFFLADGNTLRTAAVFNHEARSTYSIRVRNEADQTEQTFTITITDVNEAPEISEREVRTIAYQNSPDPIWQLYLLARDPDQDILTWSLIAAPEHGTVTFHSSHLRSFVGVAYVPASGYVGTDSFEVEVSDGSLTDTVTINVDVRLHNDPPEITEGESLTIHMVENNPPTNFDLHATDSEGHPLWWDIVTPPENGWAHVSGDGNSQTVHYAPDKWHTGTDSFVVRVSDIWLSDAITVNVNVISRAEMDCGQICEQSDVRCAAVSMSENSDPTPFELTLRGSNPENDALTWSISEPARHGLAHAEGTGYSKDISYVPDTDFNGIDTFVVQASDGEVTERIRTYVCVERQNEVPRITSRAIPYVEPGKLYSYRVEAEDPDADDTLIITASDIPSWLTLEDWGNGVAVLSGTPTEVGTYEVSLRVRDFQGETRGQTFTINVASFVSVSGTVTNVDSIPIEYVLVEISSNSNEFIGRDGTDKSGRYEITGIPRGDDYKIITSHSRPPRYGAFGEKNLSVQEDVMKDITLRNHEDLTISGYVFEADGETPIHDALIMIYSSTHSHPARTYSDPDGFYEFKGLPYASDYFVRARQSRYGEEETNDHAPGERVDIRLWPGGYICGYVKDKNGSAIKGVMLSFRSEIAGINASRSTNEYGFYSMKWLPALGPSGPVADYMITAFYSKNLVLTAYDHQMGDRVDFTIITSPDAELPDTDFNCDAAVGLADALIALKLQAGMPSPFCSGKGDGDEKIGLRDVILILRLISL